MKKIFELGPTQFLSGIASGSQLQNTGLFTRAEGITTVRNPFLESDEVGILQASPAPQDLTGSIILDTPIAWTVDPNDSVTGFPMLYFWGDNGYLYSVDLTGDLPPVNINVGESLGGMTLGANGLFVMQHSNDDKRVWYFRHEAIGFFDLSGASSFNNDEYTGLEDTIHHPVHTLFDRRYFGNGRYIGQIDDNGSGGLTVELQALDLQKGMTITTLSDDGHYLVAGATTYPPVLGGGIGSLPHGTTKIFFWDTNSSSWEREWTINDSAVYAIRRVGSVMYALTGRGLYEFTIDIPPKMVLSFMNVADAPSPQFPSHFTADVLGEALVWGNAAGSVSSYGKFIPSMKTAYMKPFAGFGSFDLSLICASAKTDDLYVGSGEDKLYRVHWSGSDDGNLTGIRAETIFIDLKRWWQIGRIVVEFDGRLQEDDDFRILLMPDSRDENGYLGGNSSFEDLGGIRVREIYCTLEARQLKLDLRFSGGSPRVHHIEIWGDPIESPTHNRLFVGSAD
jgi:hypothetical protein